MRLRYVTAPEWTKIALSDFDAFLQDHASCERKAAASALSLVNAYPEHHELVDSMFELAKEELEHYHAVYKLLHKRGKSISRSEKDPYVSAMLKWLRDPPDQYLMDRLLIFGLIEARSCERLGMVAGALEPGPVKDFYQDLTRAEARHHGLFLRLARKLLGAQETESRLDQLLDKEAELVRGLPHRSAVH